MKEETKKALEKLVKLGFLEKKKVNGFYYYRDSNKVRCLLSKGYTREQILSKLKDKGEEIK